MCLGQWSLITVTWHFLFPFPFMPIVIRSHKEHSEEAETRGRRALQWPEVSSVTQLCDLVPGHVTVQVSVSSSVELEAIATSVGGFEV